MMKPALYGVWVCEISPETTVVGACKQDVDRQGYAGNEEELLDAKRRDIQCGSRKVAAAEISTFNDLSCFLGLKVRA
jgi:hypothetical protein